MRFARPRWVETVRILAELKACTGRNEAKRGDRARRGGEILQYFQAHPQGTLLCNTPADVLVLSWKDPDGGPWVHMVLDLQAQPGIRADPWLHLTFLERTPSELRTRWPGRAFTGAAAGLHLFELLRARQGALVELL